MVSSGAATCAGMLAAAEAGGDALLCGAELAVSSGAVTCSGTLAAAEAGDALLWGAELAVSGRV